MTAVLLALSASLAWGTSDFIGGRASRGRHVIGVMGLTRPTSLTLITLLVLLTGAPAVDAHWPEAVGAGIALFGGIICLYRALAIGPMAVVAPIFATSAIVPVLYGLARGETPSALAFAGLAVAVTGSVLAARAPGTSGVATDPRGVLYAIGAAVILGAGLVLLNDAAEDHALTAVFVERCVEVLLVALTLTIRRRTLARELRAPGLLPLVGVIDITASILFATASRSGLLPVVAVLSSLYPVVTVLLARALLAERLSRLQAAGAALTLVGVGLAAAG